MLKFHEAETCEGIIQHLELRECVGRRDARARDNHSSPNARVEMTFWLGDQLYAIEHTGIEPFDGFMEHQNRAAALFKPLETQITAALSAMLSPGVAIEMTMPVDAFDGRKLREVHALQNALIEHVRVTAPTLPIRKYGDYRGTLVTATPAAVPFSVSLVRFDGPPNLPGRFQLKHLTKTLDRARTLRIQRACDHKFPKLATWKQTDNARTILVLEDNDLQLTNPSLVAEVYLPVATARADTPNETYVVTTCASPWYACPILVDGRTYFDFSEVTHPIHFVMDATGQLLKSGT